MARKWPLLIAPFVLCLAGCATPYQPLGSGSLGTQYGYYAEQVGSDQFGVGFAGNRFTDIKTANDFAQLRAAEVAMAHGFAYFSIDKRENKTVRVDTQLTTEHLGFEQGNLNETGSSFRRPGILLRVTCAHQRPPPPEGDDFVNAADLAEVLRTNYHLAPNQVGMR